MLIRPSSLRYIRHGIWNLAYKDPDRIRSQKMDPSKAESQKPITMLKADFDAFLAVVVVVVRIATKQTTQQHYSH